MFWVKASRRSLGFFGQVLFFLACRSLGGTIIGAFLMISIVLDIFSDNYDHNDKHTSEEEILYTVLSLL